MANKRITMQDIADACGLSRNTVSKVFNGRGNVPRPTADLIRQKADELGYGLPSGAASGTHDTSRNRTIAMLTCNKPADFHFGTSFTAAFTDQISRSDYTLKMFEISQEELRNKELPPQFQSESIAGIICIEMFDQDYLSLLCSTGLPAIMIDGPADTMFHLMPCDVVSMENAAAISALVKGLVRAGARHIGFVGDPDHCSSFRERWIGFSTAMMEAGLSVRKDLCILAEDQAPYHQTDWLIQQLNIMPFLPDAFVCANDFLAIHLMTALKRKGLSIPADIMVTGFDGSSQSAVVDPALTTVQIPNMEIGRMAADFLLFKVQHRGLSCSWTHVKTTPVWRESTRPEASASPS